MSLQIEKVNSREYKLLNTLNVTTTNYYIEVKKGLIFDGASIPKIFWNIIGSPFTGKYTLSALVHDALYMSESLPRKECDKIFLELMKQDGVSWLKRNIMYSAVRVGGYFVWENHDKVIVKINKKYVKVLK